VTALTFAPDVKAGILLRDGDLCAMLGATGCRSRADHHPNHRLNRGAGGSSLNIVNDAANGCAICGPCNVGIEAVPELAEEARRRGVKLSPGGSAYDVITRTPIWLPFWRQWCLLDYDGMHLTGISDPELDSRQADKWLY
jgi:hypothetical protein